MSLMNNILNGPKEVTVSKKAFKKAIKDLVYSLYDTDYQMRGYFEVDKDGKITTWSSFEDEYAYPATGKRAFLTWERGMEASPGRKREAIRDAIEDMSYDIESQMNNKGIYIR